MQWFESVDLDKNGQLDTAELQTALASSNLHLSEAVVAHMIRCAVISEDVYRAVRLGPTSCIACAVCYCQPTLLYQQMLHTH